VSRKPVSELEGDVSAGLYLNKGLGNNGLHTDVNAGGNKGTWYGQASASYLNRNQYQVSGDFQPTKYQSNGNRDNSYTNDKKINLKFGWTPHAGDEYTINYINQQGQKGTPVYAGTDAPSTNSARFWQWPYWNKESLYLVSRTGIGDNSYLKLRAYYDTFQNSITNYTNSTYTVLAAKPFLQSWYDDYSYGTSAEFGTSLTDSNTLKLAAHLKDDIHREHNLGNPVQHFKDQTTSFGVEDTQHLNAKLDLVTGVSRDARDTQQAQNYLAGNIVDFQKSNASAWNPQAGLFYHVSASDEIHATISRKSRFPTIKDRYSYRLGTAIPNSALQPERSTNYELGASALVGEKTRLTGAVFYYDVQDMIQAIAITPVTQCGGTATICTQMQNIGNVRSKGAELGITSSLTATLEIGANYTLLSRTNVSNPTILLTDVPRQKLFAYSKWQVSGPLALLGSVEADSQRYSSSDGTRIVGGFGIANVKAMYQFSKLWSAEAGVNNLLDRNYAVIEGYPLEGRNFFANASMKF
jgi:iron complex outermembrane receptor protein